MNIGTDFFQGNLDRCVMATLSLTLPISCQICLGKVKDPVICPNSHAFCTLCLDMWLRGNSCCPTCRVDITEEKPYRKVLGSGENNEELNLQSRTQLRKTRLELLGREYETEIQNLNNELNRVNQENKKLKEQLQTSEHPSKDPAPVVNDSLPNDILALSNLTKKLQEISSTYDDVRRDMNKLQEEKEHLLKQNSDLNNEVERLKEEAKFTKSPKRYEKFTILGLKAKVDQYEKENQQLRKALVNRDEYLDQLQAELKHLKSAEVTERCEQGTQVNSEIKDRNDVRNTGDDGDPDESFPNSMVHRCGASYSLSSSNEGLTELTKTTSEFQPSSIASLSSPRPTFLNQLIPTSFHSGAFEAVSTSTIPTRNSGEYSQEKELFPATKKLLQLKRMHETRTLSSSSSPPVQTSAQRSPVLGIDLSWSSCVSFVNCDSSSDTGDETFITTNDGRSQDVVRQSSSGKTSPCVSLSHIDEKKSCEEQSNHCNPVGNDLNSATTSTLSSVNNNLRENYSVDGTHGSPKRNGTEAVFSTKKIKVENP